MMFCFSDQAGGGVGQADDVDGLDEGATSRHGQRSSQIFVRTNETKGLHGKPSGTCLDNAKESFIILVSLSVVIGGVPDSGTMPNCEIRKQGIIRTSLHMYRSLSTADVSLHKCAPGKIHSLTYTSL